ncbi:DUF1822 family protein [Leptolyngbya cf. ectocarpi LEGE 11479]|uniref:DUF1822 family protein n=1 Tax=Leptolyngbya cf. ectocarpi LEGE 11479 TaxID=1828722 RepID=A0A928ZWB0_LEPEC|nr:DUF1822 family protein [Leptolyngbya ectocarpi]MBE9068653.1 DUF1822 family protein [Leptolyngbya cf. ectocarpi LEGE 11479]
MSFTFADPRQLWLDISPSTKASAWQHSQELSTSGAREQVYLNQLCISTCLAWIQSELNPAAEAFPAPDANPISWEMVTGSAVNIDDLKLVLIPTDEIGQDELRIPQEWIDIGSWAADYYLAATVNPAENWVEVWGYASYAQLKQSGEFDRCDRTYSLDAEDLTLDINALWATIDHCPVADLKADMPTDLVLAEVSTAQGDNLVTRLADPGIAFPRLAIPFAQWGAILANQVQRQELYAKRFNALQGNLASSSNTSLTEYLQGICNTVAAGWQGIEAVFSLDSQQLALRSDRGREDTAGKQAKVLRFGPEVDNLTVRLALMWEVLSDERIEIQAQLYPSEEQLYLPQNLDFRLLSATGEVIQILTTESANNYIQIQRIRCPVGYQFSLELELEGTTLVEHLTV